MAYMFTLFLPLYMYFSERPPRDPSSELGLYLLVCGAVALVTLWPLFAYSLVRYYRAGGPTEQQRAAAEAVEARLLDPWRTVRIFAVSIPLLTAYGFLAHGGWGEPIASLTHYVLASLGVMTAVFGPLLLYVFIRAHRKSHQEASAG